MTLWEYFSGKGAQVHHLDSLLLTLIEFMTDYLFVLSRLVCSPLGRGQQRWGGKAWINRVDAI